MNIQRIITVLVSLVAAILSSQTAKATSYLTEEFVNYATGQLGASGTGGGGTIPGWNTPTAQITVTNGSHSLDGTVLGLVSSFGDKAFITSSNLALVAGYPNGAYNKFVASGAFPQTTATNLYYSFLYKFDVGTDVSTVGQVIDGVNRENSGASSTATFHWLLYAKRTGANIQLGIGKVGGSTNYATTNILAGQTFFVVVRQQIITGAANDEEDLWINPPTNSFGVVEASVPFPSASATDGTEDPSSTGPGRFWIFASGSQAEFDELRIASSWAEATPPVGQCIPASIIMDPTNLTQCAEISATFNVGAVGTGPTYQWQLSQNGGASWTNIPGALFASYTTPNLALATDNGNKYRVIEDVSCNNSSATSGVAVITLTPPVITTNGLIMDDIFQNGSWNGLGFDSRAFPPVIEPTNSVWYTSVSADLDASAGDGMVATPISGTSSLYLGYFVDESTTNLPVDLDIGHTIRVTFPFIPNSFNAFTNNGALRFGLFDYADGGTLIAADSASQPNAVTGSTGNGASVRGYMLSVDFGTNFTANSPLSLLVRDGIGDVNLMGTTSDYISLGSGPSGGGYSNAPSFKPATTYTLVFAVTRTAVNTCSIQATITGGGTNWTFTATDTNGYAYHRFDSFAVRPNELENAADTFTFPEFKVEVLGASSPSSLTVTNIVRNGNSVTLGWLPSPAGAFTYSVMHKLNLNDANWITNQTGISATTYTDTGATAATGFYRVTSP